MVKTPRRVTGTSNSVADPAAAAAAAVVVIMGAAGPGRMAATSMCRRNTAWERDEWESGSRCRRRRPAGIERGR